MRAAILTIILSSLLGIATQDSILDVGIEATSQKSKPSSALNLNIASRISARASELKSYIHLEGYNDEVCFLIDMRLPSSKKRFFVFDLNNNTVMNSALVAHGAGSETGGELLFSNQLGSNATSIGKYEIGKSYNGNFGLAYKLHGLESTNDKAFERFVVLHGFGCIPEEETGEPICLSLGCPAVAPAFLEELRKIIDDSERTIILYVYY
jgi:hypothetical protein